MKKIKTILTGITLVASTWLAKAQTPTACTVNPCTSNPPPTCEFVCNGGFELNNTPPTAIGSPSPSFDQVSMACGWANANTATSPDYYYATATNTAVQTPCNLNGKEPERTGGNGYCGFLASAGGNGNWCERIYSTLTTTLNPNKVYEVSFYLSLAEGSSQLEVNNVGFTIGNNQSGVTNNPIQYVDAAQMASISKDGWTKMTYTYQTGLAGYDGVYIVIGSWHNVYGSPTNSFVTYSGSSSTISCSGAIYATDGPYYYIDDVSVKEMTPLTATASSTTGCVGESFSLTASGGANSYYWSPSTALSCTNCANPVSTATTSITYTVTGTSTASCVYNSATITISPTTCCTNTNTTNNITLRNVNLVSSTVTGVPTWTSLVSGGFYTGTISAPAPVGSSVTITNTLSIIGSFTISTPVTFSYCNISVSEASPIVQNAQTTFDHCYLFGCSYLWDGIKSYAKLRITNSWIEDGYATVVAPVVSNHPGVSMDNVMFNKNYISVINAASMNPSDFEITGCIFSSRSFGAANYTTTTRYSSLFTNIPSKAPVKIKGSTAYGITGNTIRPAEGVLMWGATSNTTTNYFTIGAVTSNTVPNSDYTNTFDYMNCGIYNLVSKVSIINNIFGNMITATTGTAIGAVVHDDGNNSPSVTKTEVGRTTSSNYKNYFCYPGTQTSSILDGVVATGGGTLNVSNNDFKIISRYGVSVKTWTADTPANEPVTVASNSYTDAAYAFYGYNNNNIEATVSTNTLVHSQNTYTAYTNVSIYETNKPSGAIYHIYNNNFTGSLYGIGITNTYGTRIISNKVTVRKPGTGVYNSAISLGNSDWSVVAQNTVDCSPTNSGSWYTYGIISDGSANDTYKCNTITKVGNCMKFQNGCSSSTIFKNSFNNTGGVDPCLVGITVQSCQSIGSIGFPTGGGYGQSDDIWGDFSSADTYCTASSNSLTTADKIYYDGGKSAALYQPSININTSGLGDFSQSYVPTTTTTANTDPCNEGARIMNPSGGGNNIPVGTKGGTYPGQTGIIENVSAKNRPRVLLYSSNNSSNARGANNSNEDLFYNVDSLLTMFAHTRDNSLLNSARNINSGINAVGQIEQNQKEFNTIYATYLQADSLVSSSQIQELKDLAVLCPNTDGLAVFEARGLIRTWDDSTDYFNECERIVPELANPETVQRLLNNPSNNPALVKPLNVYPNPNNGKLTVENSPENSIFELYDIVGRKVYSNTVGNVTQLDLTPFNNGTYLYKIIKDNKVVKEDKLIINK